MQLIKRLGWLGLWLLLGGVAWAGPTLEAITPQISPAAGEGSHIFAGKNLAKITVSWNAGASARYLFIFDATALPSNGATTSCTTSHVTNCYLDCLWVPNSTSAPNIQAFDYTTTPVAATFGLVTALSTGAGCGTFTVDTGTDWYKGMVY